MATWADNSYGGSYYNELQGQDYAVLDKETAGAVHFKAQVDVSQLRHQRQEYTARQSMWKGTVQPENHDIISGEWVFAWHDRNRNQGHEHLQIPKVQSSLSGAAVHGAEVGSRESPEYTKQVEKALRAFRRKTTVLGLATTDVNTQPNHPRNNDDQGVTVQTRGVLNCYSQLFEMPLGRLVRVRAPTPEEADPNNPAWQSRPGTHPNKAVLIPEPVAPRGLSKVLEDAVRSVVDDRDRFMDTFDEEKRNEDLDLKLVHTLVDRAIIQCLVVGNMADPRPRQAQLENTATELGLTGDRLSEVQKERRYELARRLFPRTDRFEPELALVPNNARHPLTQGQYAWPELFSCAYEVALDEAASIVGRVIQGGNRECQLVA